MIRKITIFLLSMVLLFGGLTSVLALHQQADQLCEMACCAEFSNSDSDITAIDVLSENPPMPCQMVPCLPENSGAPFQLETQAPSHQNYRILVTAISSPSSTFSIDAGKANHTYPVTRDISSVLKTSRDRLTAFSILLI